MLQSIKETIEVKSLNDLPSIYLFLNLPRHKYLLLKFSDQIDSVRQQFGEELKTKLTGYQIGIHSIEPIIGVRKLITDNEIDKFQEFFEECAFDYRQLATKLIYELSSQKKIDIQNEVPYWAFLKYWQKKGQRGVMSDWEYFFHGYHCHFIHKKTKQEIEVSLVFGLEFGDLDPYFFTNFIMSTPDYKPLPIGIYVNFEDGLRIIERLSALGKFEKINSTFPKHSGTVLKNRTDKVEIITFENPENAVKPLPKFNLFKFLGLKK